MYTSMVVLSQCLQEEHGVFIDKYHFPLIRDFRNFVLATNRDSKWEIANRKENSTNGEMVTKRPRNGHETVEIIENCRRNFLRRLLSI